MWFNCVFVRELDLILHSICTQIHSKLILVSVSVQTVIEQIFFLLFYHIIFVMFVWAYWQTVFTNIGRVPSKVCKRFYVIFIDSQCHCETLEKANIPRIVCCALLINSLITNAIRNSKTLREWRTSIFLFSFFSFSTVSSSAKWNGTACASRESRNTTTNIGSIRKRPADKQSVIWSALCTPNPLSLQHFLFSFDSLFFRTITGALRYCEKCFVIKPDRAHHCSMCKY